ncbi:MAG: leucine-rich repeat domain-containing protein [Oscillospiraceae bacterium]|nr:leucine-rich repeat domain-containing protein [Oscillospiraceae bacterium]
MSTKKLIALLITAAVLIALPIAATAQDYDYHTPEFFNENEYQKLVDFALQGDNLAKLNWDLSAPDLWDGVYWEFLEPDGKTVTSITLGGMGLTGRLDVSGFADLEFLLVGKNQLDGLDLAGNAALELLTCSENNLTALDVTESPNLEFLGCYENNLTALDLSENPKLWLLSAGSNQLATLDLSKNPLLQDLYCWGNKLTDISSLENLQNLRYVVISDNYLDLSDPKTMAVIDKIQQTVLANGGEGVAYTPQNEVPPPPTGIADVQGFVVGAVVLVGVSAGLLLTLRTRENTKEF